MSLTTRWLLSVLLLPSWNQSKEGEIIRPGPPNQEETALGDAQADPLGSQGSECFSEPLMPCRRPGPCRLVRLPGKEGPSGWHWLLR